MSTMKQQRNKRKRKIDTDNINSNTKKHRIDQPKENKLSALEKIFLRFPVIGEGILNRLDNQSLLLFKKASHEIRNFVINERFYCIRIIRQYIGNRKEFSNYWKKMITKTPVEIIKLLGVAVNHFEE